jgi:hypothetical protein
MGIGATRAAGRATKGLGSGFERGFTGRAPAQISGPPQFPTFASARDAAKAGVRDFAISEPEKIATLLVQNGLPPGLLKVEEEDLETFFLRVINMKGGAR